MKKSISRGMLPVAIQDISNEQLGYEIDQAELRLMPYIQFIFMNERRIDYRKITVEEQEILADWERREFLEVGVNAIEVSKAFWDAMSEILWLGYAGGELVWVGFSAFR